jgi:ketosteroid isomerase-like protein
MSEIARHWIDGEWTASDTVSESVNPATGAVLGQWADGGQADARAAIAAARRAFDASPGSRDRSLRHRALSEMADRFGAMLASGLNVAVFGDFRYRSNSLGKVVSSPFSILVKVADGKVTYLQFLEDSYATAASFRKDGSWTVQTEPGAEPFQVRL